MLYSYAQLGKALDVHPGTIRYHASKKHIPKPSVKTANGVYYTEQQAKIVRNYFRNRKMWQHANGKAIKPPVVHPKELGLITQKEAAEICKVSCMSFWCAKIKGLIPAPTRKYQKKIFYNADDMALIKDYFFSPDFKRRKTPSVTN